MAKTTQKFNWSTYAVLQSSTGDKQYRVDINEFGQFRCGCPAYIFSGKGGAVRTCKHCRRCEQQQQLETQGLGGATVTKSVAKPVVPWEQLPSKPAHWDTAYGICAAMLDKAQMYANETQRDALVKVLAAKLATFVPVKPVVKHTTQVVEVGIRMITFDE